MFLYKGGADVTEITNEGEATIPQLSEERQNDSTGQPIEELYMFNLIALCEIHNTNADRTAPKLDKEVHEYIDFLSGQLYDISQLNGHSFNMDGFKSYSIEMCNKLYNFNMNEGILLGGSKNRRSASPDPMSTALVSRNRSVKSRRSVQRSKTLHRFKKSARRILKSWTVQCIILISLLGSIFMSYIAYAKFQQLVNTITQTGTVFEINDFVTELGAGMGDGFSVYVWKTITNDYNLVNNYYTTMYKDLISTYLEASASTFADKAKTICVGPDVFTPGALSVGTTDFTNTVNKVVNVVTGLFTFKDTGGCMSNTLKLLTLQEIERIKTLLSLKFEEISMNHTQIRLYLQYAGLLAWPSLMYYSRVFWKLSKKVMGSIKQPANQPADQKLIMGPGPAPGPEPAPAEEEAPAGEGEGAAMNSDDSEENVGEDHQDESSSEDENLPPSGGNSRSRRKRRTYSMKNKRQSRRKVRRSNRRRN